MDFLTQDQFYQLKSILTDAFDKRGIAQLVHTKLGMRLDKLVDPDQSTPELVFDLLTWIEKRGMHTLEVLLQGAIEMKPKNGALRAFCERDVPGALKGIDPQVFAKAEMAEQRPKIFISYRREESKYQAKRMRDAFAKALPPEHVFMDVDSLPLGADFVNVLEGWVNKCEIFLALIGPNWVQAVDPKTQARRLDNSLDFVRIEIREALRREIPVVPILLDNAPMPDAESLPEDIRALVRRQAAFVDFRTFDSDVHRLIRKLGIKRQRHSRKARESVSL